VTREAALLGRWTERLRAHPPRRIAFTDATDDRVLSAVARLHEEGALVPVLIGARDDVLATAARNALDLGDVETIDPRLVADDERLVRRLTIAMQGRTPIPMDDLAVDPLYAGVLLLDAGRVDGCVSGAARTSGDVIRAGIRVVGLGRDASTVNSCFLLVLPDGRPVAYGDCAVIPEPNAEELAQIAISTAGTYRLLAESEPVIALLSFSTKGSADTTSSERVRLAAAEVRRIDGELVIDGELQFDAAVSPRVAEIKAPGSAAAGRANVFVFPNLDAGNIAYKVTQYFAEAAAFGPLLQGMAKPLNDLSRGCVADDVVAVAKITALQALGRRLAA
jgi:phosphotransacetylase